jgi:hypothetical protein
MTAFHPFRPQPTIADVRCTVQTERMRVFAFAALSLLVSCSQVENTFTVEDEGRAVAVADLVLCDATTPLKRVDGPFAVSKSISCEGEGYIRLTYASGQERECRIGYVTPGAKQDFKFRAGEAECQSLVS